MHQFCRVGAHAFIGMGVLLSGDVPPFTMVAGDAAGRLPCGINSEGLKRRGFDADRIAAIKRAYRTLYVAGLPLAEAKTAAGRTWPRRAPTSRRAAALHRKRRTTVAAMNNGGNGEQGERNAGAARGSAA